MLTIPERLARELPLKLQYVQNALALRAEGATVPFIARYRKERIGSMDEAKLRKLFDRYTALTELEQRKAAILKTIEAQGKLTEALRATIEATHDKRALEDLFLPFKPKKQTQATAARERGLEPLAEFIKALNVEASPEASLEEEAAKYVSPEKGIATTADALAGAAEILAEEIAEKASLRGFLRNYLLHEGFFVSKIKGDLPPGSTKFEMYRDYKVKVKDVQAHNVLAMLRGEHEGVLSVSLQFDEGKVQQYLAQQEIRTKHPPTFAFYQDVLSKAFEQLMRPSLEHDVREEKKEFADRESIKTFEANLRELLLSSPAGMKPTLGIDPGFRSGCKVAVVNEKGKFLHHATLHPFQSDAQRLHAGQLLLTLIKEYNIELIAIGNGNLGRETDQFVGEVIKDLEKPPVKVLVNEAGASVYAASRTAIEEFPKLDIAVRGAISIARRLQDPLAELVKIDPKSIGVGQYQHDVDQKLLKRKLDETVESCVNAVGVDLNLASVDLLKYVSGLDKATAHNIVTYRDEHGLFRNRQELMNVPQFRPKTFEQAAGFLRIRDGENPLDNTAVHPESYPIAERILHDLGVTIDKLPEVADKLNALDIKQYVTATAGEPTIRDIITELLHPGHDPRGAFVLPKFNEGIKDISDLQPGMELEGIVTNVANFGAFVDIGIHQDGLVHVSQLADKFVADPKKVVKVGQIVKVRVLEVNPALKRISLTMKSPNAPPPRLKQKPPQRKPVPKNVEKKKTEQPKQAPAPQREESERHFTLEDLKAKFNAR
ncbi:MAG: RNA-binding transcriptional accessory protein [Ignavibacteria bacterium]